MNRGWRDVAEKAASDYCGKGIPPTDTIKKSASKLSKDEIKRACESANHQINASMLKTGSRYPRFPVADHKKIHPMKKQASTTMIPLRRTGTYQAGDELAGEYEALFEEKIASMQESVKADKPSLLEIKMFREDIDNQLGAECILASEMVEKIAQEFVDVVRSTLWETPPEVVVRAVVDTAADESTKIWALGKIAATVKEMGSSFDDGFEIPGNYEKDAGLVPLYKELEDAFVTLRNIEVGSETIMSKLAELTPDTALDVMIDLVDIPQEKIAIVGPALGQALNAFFIGTSMMDPALKMKAMRDQYDQAGFGQPPAPPTVYGR